MESLDAFFKSILSELTGPVKILEYHRLGGGCINEAAKVLTDRGNFFIKWNTNSPEKMFHKEFQGLELLRQSETVRIPRPLLAAADYLIMELLEPASRQSDYWEVFGRELAQMHRQTSEKHGLDHSNYIGRLEQSNAPDGSWINFFSNERLRAQLRLAKQNGLIDSSVEDDFEELIDRLPELIPELDPSLMHGDMWSGNFMTGPDGNAWLIDPAVYYGSREMELAFTELFGGFDQQFYDAYHEAFPLEPGFDERVDIYNLYPLLVHLNLFGLSYLGQIKRILNRFV